MILLLLPLIAGVGLIVAANVVGRWLINADPKRIAKLLRSSGGAVLILFGLFLIFRGQWLLGSAFLSRGASRAFHGHGGGGGFAGGGFAGGFGGRTGQPSGGQSSTVRTALLEATLDHDTGDIDATVLAGRFEGRTLRSLSDGECVALWDDAAGDEESRLLLEAYLDRRRPDWRDDVEGDRNDRTGRSGGSGARSAGAMTEDEAYDVLGLAPGASEAEIRTAHRRLMKQMHPDHGGSTFLAAKLNEAKDVLLRRR